MLHKLVGFAVVVALGWSAAAQGQNGVLPGPVSDSAAAYAPVPLPPPDRLDVTPTQGGAGVAAQFSFYPLRTTPPTLMTSINYPGVYGAYYIGAAPSAWVPGLSLAPMTLRPTYTTLAPSWATPPYPEPVPPAMVPSSARQFLTAEQAAATASITIYTPEQASVWVQGDALPGSGSRHRFTTPPLPRNQLFSYEVRAMWSQDGEPVSDTRTVIVQAGKQHRIGFAKRIYMNGARNEHAPRPDPSGDEQAR